MLKNDINEYIKKLLNNIIENTNLKFYIQFNLIENINIIDSIEDLLGILNIKSSKELKSLFTNKPIVINDTSIVILGKYREYFIFSIDDHNNVTVYNVSRILYYNKFSNIYNLNLADSILYEKIKRMRGVK